MRSDDGGGFDDRVDPDEELRREVARLKAVYRRLAAEHERAQRRFERRPTVEADERCRVAFAASLDALGDAFGAVEEFAEDAARWRGLASMVRGCEKDWRQFLRWEMQVWRAETSRT